MGQEARCTPLCGLLLMGAVGLDTPRSGLEKRIRSPRPRWAGGAVDPAMRGLVEACWVGHPWRGGEENVVPPPAMGRRRGGHPLCGVLWWNVGLDTPGGMEKRMWSPPPAMGRRRGGPRYAGSC